MRFSREEQDQWVRLGLRIQSAIRDFMVAETGQTAHFPISTHVIGAAIVAAVRSLNDMNATAERPHVITRYVAENLAGRRLNDVFGPPTPDAGHQPAPGSGERG